MYIKFQRLYRLFSRFNSFWGFLEQVETKILADVVGKPDGVLYAEGNVTVQYGSIYVKAKAYHLTSK